MGATTFQTTRHGWTMTEAYNSAVEDAVYERGSDAYNGTISTTSGGNDIWGNPIVAYTFQTIQVPNTTVPSAEVAWYTWMVSTGATNGLTYSTIKEGSSNPPSTNFTMNTAYSTLIVNYSGSTNIPAGTYRVYTTKPGAGVNLTNFGNNLYWQGGTLI